MATIKLQGNASGSGSVTLTAPSTNSARTITLPDQDVDFGNLAGAGSAVAWVNFNGRNTVAIRADGNVSSITDNGSGDYTANFSNALVDANYAFLGCLGNSKNAAVRVFTVFATSDEGTTPYTQSSTAVRFVGAWSGTSFDVGLCYIGITR